MGKALRWLGGSLFCVAQCASAASYAYGWRDAQGQWHFSDRSPAHAAAVLDLSPRNAQVGPLSSPAATVPAEPAVPTRTTSKPKTKTKSKPQSAALEPSPVGKSGEESGPAPCAEWRERLSLAAGPMTPSARRKMENDYDRKCVLEQR